MEPTFVVPPWRQPLSCYSRLITAPTEEPITVAEAKLRAGMNFPDTDPREALTAQFIAAARNQVERDTGLALLTQTRDIYFCPYDPAAPWPLPSLSTPLQAITEFEAWDPTSIDLPAAVSALTFVSPWRMATTWASISPLSAWPSTGGAARMRIVAGWPSVAALTAEAPTLVHAVGLLAAHMLTLGRDLAITGAVAAISETPQGYDDCLAPHRLVWVA